MKNGDTRSWERMSESLVNFKEPFWVEYYDFASNVWWSLFIIYDSHTAVAFPSFIK